MYEFRAGMDRKFSDKLTLAQRSLAIERYQSLKSPNHRILLLLGVVGAGKSNFLAGESVAKVGSGFYGVTTESGCNDIEIQGRWLRVVDTPGYFDPLRNKV